MMRKSKQEKREKKSKSVEQKSKSSSEDSKSVEEWVYKLFFFQSFKSINSCILVLVTNNSMTFETLNGAFWINL